MKKVCIVLLFITLVVSATTLKDRKSRREWSVMIPITKIVRYFQNRNRPPFDAKKEVSQAIREYKQLLKDSEPQKEKRRRGL